MLDYRKLPPVEPIAPPSRLSMTLLAKADDCPRSAYLYVKHRGGPGSHPMDRGTLGHAVMERGMKELIVRGEPRFAPEDPEQAASMMAALVDEVLRERPDLVVPQREVDDVREMAFHWAVAYDVDPEHVAGLERLMVLDLACGWTVSGRLDVIALPSPDLGQVDDWKTGRAMPTQEEYEGSVQPNVYAVLLLFGAPVDVVDCTMCGYARVANEGPCRLCDGKGYIEVRGEPGALGAHLQGVLTRELYPHAKPRDDGSLHRREMLLARTAVADYLADLERMAETLGERFGTEFERCPSCAGETVLRCTVCGGLDCYPSFSDRDGDAFACCTTCGGPDIAPVMHEAVPCDRCAGRGVVTNGSWDFPARSGSWCSECPASQECPLPAHLRDHAGTINTVEQATEAWEKAQVAKAQLAAVEREVKNFARAHDVEIRVGDLSWRWQPKEGRAVRRVRGRSDWDGLVAAVVEAAEYGARFDVSEFVVPTTGSEFKKVKVNANGEAR